MWLAEKHGVVVEATFSFTITLTLQASLIYLGFQFLYERFEVSWKTGVSLFGFGGEVAELDDFGGEMWCCQGCLISFYDHCNLPILPNQSWVSLSNCMGRVV
jgi:hypothetical protein